MRFLFAFAYDNHNGQDLDCLHQELFIAADVAIQGFTITIAPVARHWAYRQAVNRTLDICCHSLSINGSFCQFVSFKTLCDQQHTSQSQLSNFVHAMHALVNQLWIDGSYGSLPPPFSWCKENFPKFFCDFATRFHQNKVGTISFPLHFRLGASLCVLLVVWFPLECYLYVVLFDFKWILYILFVKPGGSLQVASAHFSRFLHAHDNSFFAFWADHSNCGKSGLQSHNHECNLAWILLTKSVFFDGHAEIDRLRASNSFHTFWHCSIFSTPHVRGSQTIQILFVWFCQILSCRQNHLFSWVQRSRANLPKFWPKFWENLREKNGGKVAFQPPAIFREARLKSDTWFTNSLWLRLSLCVLLVCFVYFEAIGVDLSGNFRTLLDSFGELLMFPSKNLSRCLYAMLCSLLYKELENEHKFCNSRPQSWNLFYFLLYCRMDVTPFSRCMFSFRNIGLCGYVHQCLQLLFPLRFLTLSEIVPNDLEFHVKLCAALRQLLRLLLCVLHVFVAGVVYCVYRPFATAAFEASFALRLFFFLMDQLLFLRDTRYFSPLVLHAPQTCGTTKKKSYKNLLYRIFHFDTANLPCKFRPCICLKNFIQAHSLVYHMCPWVMLEYDCTLGFPGEGPPWSLLSANINSLNAHPHWMSWNDDVLCFQETRLTEANLNEPKYHLHKIGKSIFHGRLLENKKRKNGMSHTPHGGTAILAPTSYCCPFTQDHDIACLWTYLFDSTRWSGLWIQVCPKVKLLVLNFYGYATNPDFDHIAANEDMLQKAFQIVAQFGQVPIIITGDFQAEPDTYTCIQNAKRLAGWVDPLTTTDSLGNNCRPITYSRNADFHRPVDNFSSIDAIILNPAAAAALVDTKVVYEDARQHAPIRATFQWERIFQRGYVLDKPAAFNLSNLPRKGNEIDTESLDICANKLWQDTYKNRVESNNDEESWQSINDFAADVLLHSGATYNRGPKGRGRKPVFKTHVVCPGQDSSGCAFTNKSTKLAKLHRYLNELEWRLGRQPTCYADMQITCQLQEKVAYLIPKISQSHWWNPELHMFQEAISCVKKEVCHEIDLQKQREKRYRISEWKQRMISATRTKKVDKCVFDWIKNKTTHSKPNLIRNKDGDIILSPVEAISEINSQWDDIFSANVLHEDPEKILSTVWPYISDKHTPACIPPLTGLDLKQTAATRKNAAAPGLDGWRTIEVKALPLCVFDAIAAYFVQIENGARNFPVNLGFVKQIILDKGGQDLPLQKRLISLLSIFVLCYTGLRFKQLQNWQQQIMPKQLFGGIKGRNMSEVFSRVQLEIDFAKQQNTDLIGLKLDKSKCFDRLIPSVTSSLFLAFGVPVTVVTFFIQMYTNLRRFLAYKEWISPTSTTAANGLIQGCSMSLLAINVHMAVWAIFMDRIPHVNSSVFIDDSYLWAKAVNVASLQMAIQTTESWDDLVGQLLNARKCQVWATSPASRRIAQHNWPNMLHSTNLEILGARIQLSDQLNYEWPQPKTDKILRDLQLIRAIPCSRAIHEHLISTKVTPQLTFAAQINCIPKKALSAIHNSVANVLWKNRPKWRSKGLLTCLLAKPHRIDPFVARAYASILDCITYLKSADQTHREMWVQLYETDVLPKNSLMAHFLQACEILDIELCGPFRFSLWNCQSVSWCDFARRDLKRILQVAARHKAYFEASRSSRKDLNVSEHILDYDATILGDKSCVQYAFKNTNLMPYREATLVGSCATNDRRYAAAMSDTDICRYCGETKETFEHLVLHCKKLPIADKKPSLPTQHGPNFSCFGIVEIDFVQVQNRLRCSSPSHVTVAHWSQSECGQTVSLWTDGSCDLQSAFWYTVGGYSVVNQQGSVIDQGPVLHWALSSYACELWALYNAFAKAHCPVICSTDCQTLVYQVRHMIHSRSIPQEWALSEWWNALLNLFMLRLAFADNPLVVKWIPAHVLEHKEICEISPSEAAKYNTTLVDIQMNRIADKAAKFAMTQQKISTVTDHENFSSCIKNWQTWISLVSACLGETSVKPQLQSEINPGVLQVQMHKPKSSCDPTLLTVTHSLDSFSKCFPKWEWNHPQDLFVWSSSFDTTKDIQSYAKISNDQWNVITQSLVNIKWSLGEKYQSAFIEIAYHLWYSGIRIPEVQPFPSAYATIIRKVINQAQKLDCGFLVPGSISSAAKSRGKTLPAGFVQGAWFQCKDLALKHLAIDCRNRSQSLKSWAFQFSN